MAIFEVSDTARADHDELKLISISLISLALISGSAASKIRHWRCSGEKLGEMLEAAG